MVLNVEYKPSSRPVRQEGSKRKVKRSRQKGKESNIFKNPNLRRRNASERKEHTRPVRTAVTGGKRCVTDFYCSMIEFILTQHVSVMKTYLAACAGRIRRLAST